MERNFTPLTKVKATFLGALSKSESLGNQGAASLGCFTIERLS
jgi:hypothetical protein